MSISLDLDLKTESHSCETASKGSTKSVQIDHPKEILKAYVCYFSLFLKDKCFSFLVWTKYIEKKFTLQLLFLPTVLCYTVPTILSWAMTRYLPPWNFLFRKNNCMCNQDNARDVPLVQMNKAWKEVNQTNQVQTKINIVKGLQTSVIHLIPGSTCHWISNRMRYFLKNIFWSKHFPATTNCRSRHSRVFLVKPVLKIS